MAEDHPSSYGDTFVDVYDSWYQNISDIDANVSTVLEVAAGREVLELGVGTGRIALPLVLAGASVTGLDASRAMLARCRAKPGSEKLRLVCADMADTPVNGPFGVVFVSFNTFFNLTAERAQQACVERVAALLHPGGSFLVEAFVPSPDPPTSEYHESARSDDAGGTVLSVTVRHPTAQIARGVHVHTTSTGDTISLPWAIRYLHIAQLDTLCGSAGLNLVERWSDWSRQPFGSADSRHVSHYQLADLS